MADLSYNFCSFWWNLCYFMELRFGLPPQARVRFSYRLCVFFGVGLCHPKGSLLMEVDAVAVVWLLRVKCTAFWLKILSNPGHCMKGGF